MLRGLHSGLYAHRRAGRRQLARQGLFGGLHGLHLDGLARGQHQQALVGRHQRGQAFAQQRQFLFGGAQHQQQRKALHLALHLQAAGGQFIGRQRQAHAAAGHVVGQRSGGGVEFGRGKGRRPGAALDGDDQERRARRAARRQPGLHLLRHSTPR